MAIKTLTTEILTVVLYPVLPPGAGLLDLPMTAPTVALDGIDFACSGREVVIIQNTDAVNPYTFTLKSVADSYNRVGDVGPYTLQAGDLVPLIPPTYGFAQAVTGRILIVMENVAVKVGVFRVPNAMS